VFEILFRDRGRPTERSIIQCTRTRYTAITRQRTHDRVFKVRPTEIYSAFRVHISYVYKRTITCGASCQRGRFGLKLNRRALKLIRRTTRARIIARETPPIGRSAFFSPVVSIACGRVRNDAGETIGSPPCRGVEIMVF